MDLPTSFRLDGRVAVVIGGTGALGGRIAEALADAGARTVIVGRDAARAEAVLGRLQNGAREVTFEACDASVRSALHSLLERILALHSRVDILVNGAGTNSATPFLEISDDELERIITVNQLTVMRACQEFGRYFVDRAVSHSEGASIVNIGSTSGLTPLSQVFTYSMAKAAVHNLTKNLARESGRHSASAATCSSPDSSQPSRTGRSSPPSARRRSCDTPRWADSARSMSWPGRLFSSRAMPGALSPEPNSSSTAVSAR